jgi:aminopeptidase N
VDTINIDGLYSARNHMKKYIAKQLKTEFQEIYSFLSSNEPYAFTPAEVGRRRLRNTCLDYLSTLVASDSSSTTIAVPEILSLIKKQYETANCMTDRISALIALGSIPSSERDNALEDFYIQANHNALVINKWFSIQAMSDYPTVVEDMIKLKNHNDFLLSNPNRARSLLSVFGSGNLYHFHRIDGKGYEFLADSIIELDAINPLVAARMMSSFALWKKFDMTRQKLMKEQLIKIQSIPNLSRDTYEIVNRYLK